jgi:uncharacterized protein YqhQ
MSGPTPTSGASQLVKEPDLPVGGQAVIEGVMMRSPKSFAVVCRRPDGSIVIKESAWQPLWKGVKPLRWPFFRGTIVLLESMMNGMSALSFSADQQVEEHTAPKPQSLGAMAAPQHQQDGGGMGGLAKFGMMAISLVFGLALFVGVPHILSWLLGRVLGFDTSSFAFHAIDGVIKMALLLAYLSLISLMPDIRRVFQYHGAEHKAIFTYEQGLPLTVDQARQQTRFHPRCGTSFLLIVILVSVVLFSIFFATVLAQPISGNGLVDNLIKIAIKIPLMFPVAGLAYELIKLNGKYCSTQAWARWLSAPGMWLQRITTKEPDDSQLEIALISIRKALWRERSGEAAEGGIRVYKTAAEIDLPVT